MEIGDTFSILILLHFASNQTLSARFYAVCVQTMKNHIFL
jgi:hypothetical protein